MAYGKAVHIVTRKGKLPRQFAVYEPNGPRECERRVRQLNAGQLTFIRVEPSEVQGSFDFSGRGTFKDGWWTANRKAA